MTDDYLRITVELVNWKLNHGEGSKFQERRMYPVDHVDTYKYHTYMTYEILELLKNVQRAQQEHL